MTFAQVLSRHGARAPTSDKSKLYAKLISDIQHNATAYDKSVTFLQHFQYSLGSDELTTFGEQELHKSGSKFFSRYASLGQNRRLFVRASGQRRVIQSARKFTQGYHEAMKTKSSSKRLSDYPYDILIIPEGEKSNNTLNHGSLCTNFKDQREDIISARGKDEWTSTFASPIRDRLNKLLPGVNLTLKDVISIMDLCPYHTVDNPAGMIDPNFCSLFTIDEWKQYDYYQSVDKFHHFGAGDPFGPSLGIGWTNELISRLTHKPVQDETSTNHTLDSNPKTFPIGSEDVIFADFSHDNDITGILFALGLYNSTTKLDSKAIQKANAVGGYSAAWTVPFAARLYVEKMTCNELNHHSKRHSNNEYIRFLVNDRVIPLSCSDEDGKCKLDEYISTLEFAKSGGNWTQCFT